MTARDYFWVVGLNVRQLFVPFFIRNKGRYFQIFIASTSLLNWFELGFLELPNCTLTAKYRTFHFLCLCSETMFALPKQRSLRGTAAPGQQLPTNTGLSQSWDLSLNCVSLHGPAVGAITRV